MLSETKNAIKKLVNEPWFIDENSLKNFVKQIVVTDLLLAGLSLTSDICCLRGGHCPAAYCHTFCINRLVLPVNGHWSGTLQNV